MRRRGLTAFGVVRLLRGSGGQCRRRNLAGCLVELRQLSGQGLGIALAFGRHLQDDFGDIVAGHFIYLSALICDGNALGEEVGEQFLGSMMLLRTFNCPVEVITVFFPVTRFGYPWQAGVERGFDQAVLPVFEGGGKNFFDLIVGQFVGVVTAGAEEVEGIADNHDRRFARTASIIFF